MSTPVNPPRQLDDIPVDPSLPPRERIARFISAAGDPYQYQCGGLTVNLEFTGTKSSLQDTLEKFMIQKKQELS